nr:hypothetical protein BaRGS_008508 [Batillaria attramentaria]
MTVTIGIPVAEGDLSDPDSQTYQDWVVLVTQADQMTLGNETGYVTINVNGVAEDDDMALIIALVVSISVGLLLVGGITLTICLCKKSKKTEV